eukprot:scaffold11601_cov31-Tisochrysis_lutea.AAC.3
MWRKRRGRTYSGQRSCARTTRCEGGRRHWMLQVDCRGDTVGLYPKTDTVGGAPEGGGAVPHTRRGDALEMIGLPRGVCRATLPGVKGVVRPDLISLGPRERRPI